MKTNTFYSCYYIFILVLIILVYKIKNRKVFKILKYNDKNMYFTELPIGITGVIYNDVAYIYDKESLTKCSGIYDSVFEIIGKDKYFSKCFVSEEIIKHIFQNATPSLGNVNFDFPIIIDH